MNHKPTITIGIPAYNEEQNIAQLIQQIFSQKTDLYLLKEIIIVSDGSTDTTEKIVKKLAIPNLKLIEFSKRKGQIACQNTIFLHSHTDYVIILEADTLPIDNNYLNNLVHSALRNSKLGLVQGNIRLAKNNTLLGKVLSAQKEIYHRFTTQNHSIYQWFTSGRGGRLFTQKVYEKLRWPSNTPEDVYAHLWCVTRNIPIAFAHEAICYYKCPQKMQDYIWQIQKNSSGQQALLTYFPDTLIQYIYKRPLKITLQSACEFLISNPLYFIFYCLIQTYAQFVSKRRSFTDFWRTSNSTKKFPIL